MGIPNSLPSFWYLANRQQIMGLVYFDKRAFAYLINPVAPWQTTQFIMPVPNCLYAWLSYLELNANTCLSLCSAGFSLWLRESRAGIEREQCQPGTWCLIFACPCPSCPLGFLFCYCWAACNSPLRRTVSTTLQLTSHFFPRAFSCTLWNWKCIALWNCLQAWVNTLMLHSLGTKWTRNSNKAFAATHGSVHLNFPWPTHA